MAIDAYSPCPGGTGKKIKFCCPDSLGDLEKIDRMIDGQQYQACLSHVQATLAKTPDRACLLAARSLLLRITEDWEAAGPAAEEFVQKHPHNSLAWAEMAIITAHREGGRAAVAALQRALTLLDGGEMQLRIYEAIGTVAEALAVEEEVIAAMPLLVLQTRLNPDDPQPAQLMAELTTASDVPLLEKSEQQLPYPPADAPWKSEYEEALTPANRGCWSLAAERLAAMIQRHGDQPVLWRALATLRAWLADREGCVEALRKYVTLDVPLEDAVEAQTFIYLQVENPLGDELDILSATFAVQDVEQVQMAFSLSRQISPAKVDPMTLAEPDQPPPKTVYYLCDRPLPESGAEPTLENTPRMYCQALLYGRQTDREARLELRGLRDWGLESVKTLLRDVAGDQVTGPIEQNVVQRLSKTQDLLLPNLRVPEGTGLEKLRKLTDAQRDIALATQWVQLPLGALDGKTPEEAAQLDAYRVRVLAAIMLIESWFESRPDGIDLNPLREKLGLPTLGPIEPQPANLRALTLVRLPRIDVDKLDDEQLVDLFRIAQSYNVRSAIKRLGKAIFQRPTMAGKDEQVEACAMLARLEGTSDQAMVYIEHGRNAAKAAKRSCAMWDLLELSYQLGRSDGEAFMRVLSHVQSQHLNEPGVSEALVKLLMYAGLIRPDGTPAMPPTAATPEGAGASAPAPEPGKLWTPESQRPAEERKIWMPGMD